VAVAPDEPGFAAAQVVESDPGGEAEAINRYREVAKWLVAVFSGIAGLLLAGTSLTSLGSLDLPDDLGRLLAAIAGLALALGMTVLLIARALSVLRPVEMALDDVLDDPELRAALDRRPLALPLGAATVEEVRDELQDALDNPLLSAYEKEQYRDVVGPLVARAAYLRARSTFERAWRDMAWAAAVAAIGVIVFVYAANPPSENAPEAAEPPVVPPKPVLVELSLTPAGREALRTVLGRSCTTRRPRALAIGGRREAPLVVTLPERNCQPAQILLTPELGVATGSLPASVP
jgi:hypothetical protein